MIKQVKKLRRLLKTYNLIDIIIFGSGVKRALHPKDIDVCVIAESPLDRARLRNDIESCINKPLHLTYYSLKDYDKFITLTLIREGYSLKHQKYLHEVFRLQPSVLYRYELKSLTNSKKVMFERAIKKFTAITKLSNRVVLVPIEHSGEFSSFLEGWDLDVSAKEYHLMPLVRMEE